MVRFRAFDRLEQEGDGCRGKLIAAKCDDELFHIKVCLEEPLQVRGMNYLTIESPDGPPVSRIYLPDERQTRVLTGAGQRAAICGSDVSYEDLERWRRLHRDDETKRLDDSKVDGHEVYVLEERPSQAAKSQYERVVSYVDKNTCVVIRSESFEKPGSEPRKVATAVAEKVDGRFVSSELRVEDLRDRTHTIVEVDDYVADGKLVARSLEPSQIDHRCR